MAEMPTTRNKIERAIPWVCFAIVLSYQQYMLSVREVWMDQKDEWTNNVELHLADDIKRYDIQLWIDRLRAENDGVIRVPELSDDTYQETPSERYSEKIVSQTE